MKPLSQKSYKINLKYAIICFVTVVLTFLLHEGTHFITGRLLGYNMWMDLNSAGLKEGQIYNEIWHEQLVSISGPIITITQAVVFFFIIKKTKNLNWYPILFTAALMRLLAGIVSAFINPNDEARVSEWLGIGKMTLPVVVSLLLIYLVIKISIDFKILWKFNLGTYLLLSTYIAALILTNQFLLK